MNIDDDMQWYAVYTKARAENAVSTLLLNAGIEILNPKIVTRKYIRRRYAETVEQFFPCYIFARFDNERYGHMVRFTRGVRYIVGKERPIAVHLTMIEALRRRMVGDIVEPLRQDFDAGERVLIKEGPFRNFFGVFEREVPGRERVMILLEALHCSLEIEPRSLLKA